MHIMTTYMSKTQNYFSFYFHIRTIPQLVWHRQNWDILYPWVDSSDQMDLQSLTSNSYYVAGFTDASVENQTELYDVFANGE